MKSAIIAILIVGLGLTIAFKLRHELKARAVSFRTSDSLSDDCSDHLQVSGRQFASVVKDEESRNLPNQPLNLYAEQNGGIQITTWDRPDFSIKLCKQVASDSDSEGRKVLAATRLQVNGNKVSVEAPDSDDDFSLGTLLLVKAPKDASVSMEVENGGISMRNFTGTAEAKAENGGVTVRDSQGKLSVHAENGGVSFSNCNGDVTAEVENGGVSISLPDRWEGKGLSAHTENGGLNISVPRNFHSALEASGSDYVSIVCKGDVCDSGQRSSDNGRNTFRLGSGDPVIHATTVNGGIVIRNRDSSRDSI